MSDPRWTSLAWSAVAAILVIGLVWIEARPWFERRARVAEFLPACEAGHPPADCARWIDTYAKRCFQMADIPGSRMTPRRFLPAKFARCILRSAELGR